MARAIWKGQVALGRECLPVKLYSAVEDRKVHFRLLHAKDLAPVEQRVVRKSDGREVPRDEQRKAFPLERDRAVLLEADELESLVPRASRAIELCRFVPLREIGDQWYDRPYLLGPDGDDDGDYFALAAALERRAVAGIARWVMRRKRYAGVLRADAGYLSLITLRRADQVLAVSAVETPKARQPDAKELRLAAQLVDSVAGAFEPQAFSNEYRERVLALIEAKARGEHVETPKPKARAASRGLAEQLQRSLGAKERKVA